MSGNRGKNPEPEPLRAEASRAPLPPHLSHLVRRLGHSVSVRVWGVDQEVDQRPTGSSQSHVRLRGVAEVDEREVRAGRARSSRGDAQLVQRDAHENSLHENTRQRRRSGLCRPLGKQASPCPRWLAVWKAKEGGRGGPWEGRAGHPSPCTGLLSAADTSSHWPDRHLLPLHPLTLKGLCRGAALLSSRDGRPRVTGSSPAEAALRPCPELPLGFQAGSANPVTQGKLSVSFTSPGDASPSGRASHRASSVATLSETVTSLRSGEKQSAPGTASGGETRPSGDASERRGAAL